jgi:hypothetical protein
VQQGSATSRRSTERRTDNAIDAKTQQNSAATSQQQ